MNSAYDTLFTSGAKCVDSIEILSLQNVHQLAINVSPNPTVNTLSINAQNESSAIAHIALYNSLGQCVLSKVLNTTNYQLSTTNYPIGIYCLYITLADGRKGIVKVLKE